jgi:nucleotide-binding universal stress UspA family protein
MPEARNEPAAPAHEEAGVILIGYDVSPDAKAAIERVGELLRGESATGLTVWRPMEHILVPSPTGPVMMAGKATLEETDSALRKEAERRATEGAELAGRAGFDARPLVCKQETTTSDAILSTAEQVGAIAIVLGCRGLTRLKSLLLGSVSHAVTQHADRMVIVVPSPAVAAGRARSRQHNHRRG